MLAQVRPWGNGQGIRISKQMLNNVGLQIDDDVEIVSENGALIIKPIAIRPLKNKLTIEKLFENWDGQPPDKLPDWEQMKPVGRELL